MHLVRHEATIAEGRPGERRLHDGHEAVDGRQAEHPRHLGGLAAGRAHERGGPGGLAAAQADIEWLGEALKEMGVRLMLLEGKRRSGSSKGALDVADPNSTSTKGQVTQHFSPVEALDRPSCSARDPPSSSDSDCPRLLPVP